MLKDQCKVGMKIYFGRTHGEKSLGIIRKLNRVNAVVELLEIRGNGKGSTPGSQWKVPYSMMTPADENTKIPEFDFSVFMPYEDTCILNAIVTVYSHLSPENLTCDGELSRSEINQKYRQLQNKLKHLFNTLGREVSEENAYKWYEKQQQNHKVS